MYQNEGAVWEILEPMTKVGGGSGKSALPVQSNPHRRWNMSRTTCSTWIISGRFIPVTSTRKCSLSITASRGSSGANSIEFRHGCTQLHLRPGPGGKIPASAISTIKRKSLLLDVNILTYDPCDHFDNGYIPKAGTG